MILAGDEIAHTQEGNNNAYCQDNELTWINWELTPSQEELLKFTRRVIAVFHEHPVFHRRRWFHGKAIQGQEAPDIAWLDPTGAEMSGEAWTTGYVRCLGVQLFGGNIDVDERGEQIKGDTLLLLFNADHSNTIPFTIPSSETGQPWQLVLDTMSPEIGEREYTESVYELGACSVVVLRSPQDASESLL